MAVQAGMGLSRIVVLAGAGYTGSILMKNGKLSDMLGELQGLLKKLENSGEEGADPAYQEVLLNQIRNLGNQVNSLKARPVIINGGSGTDYVTYLPAAAAVGAVGYGYMWLKGYSFSDIMYVTKANMGKAVSNLTTHLNQVSDALASAKKHLTQRIQNVDDQVKLQIELSRKTDEKVDSVQRGLAQVGCSVADIQSMVYTLEGKMVDLEKKQDFANSGVAYLCNFVNGKEITMPDHLQKQLKLTGNPTPCLPATEATQQFLPGLKDLMETLAGPDDVRSRNLIRTVSSRC